MLGNLSAGMLIGGTFEADAGSTLQFGPQAGVTTDASNLVLNGAGSAIQWQSVAGGPMTTLAQSLGTVGPTGTLSVVNGASFVASGTLVDQGVIALGGAAFGAAALTISAGGTLLGAGSVAGPITDQGLLEASGGTLTLSGAVGGAGTIGIDADAVLNAAGAVGGAVVTFLDRGGTLAVGQPGQFSAAIAGFATSDQIALPGTVVTGVSFASNVLKLTGGSGAIGSLTFVGDYSGYGFGVYGDGHGGSVVVLT